MGPFFSFLFGKLAIMRCVTTQTPAVEQTTKNHSKACPHLMRFQKYAFLLSLKTRRSIRVHTTVLMRFRLSLR